jgi:5-methylcytosine-specific restriction endonuclease McrA
MCHEILSPEEHKIYHREASRKWREAHPDKAKEVSRKNHASHREDDKHRTAAFLLANPEYQSNWQKQNPEASKARWIRYHLNHPEQGHIDRARRRARKLQAQGFCTTQQWVDRVAYFGCRCFYCRRELTWEPKRPNTVTQEHLIPLSRNGSNWPANLVPACLDCNLKKGKKKLAEWVGFEPTNVFTSLDSQSSPLGLSGTIPLYLVDSSMVSIEECG